MQTLGATPANVPLARNNLAGSVDPTATDDSSRGYDTNSMWITATNNKVWICTDNTPGHATWHPLGLVFPLSNFTASVDPAASDDNSKGYSPGSIWLHGPKAWLCMSAALGAAVWAKLV